MLFSSQWIQLSGTCILQWAMLTIYSSCKQCACMHSAQHYIHPVDQAWNWFWMQYITWDDMYVHLWLIYIYWATLTMYSCCKQSAAMHAPYEPITAVCSSTCMLYIQHSSLNVAWHVALQWSLQYVLCATWTICRACINFAGTQASVTCSLCQLSFLRVGGSTSVACSQGINP